MEKGRAFWAGDTRERQTVGRPWCFQRTRGSGVAALPHGRESQKVMTCIVLYVEEFSFILYVWERH